MLDRLKKTPINKNNKQGFISIIQNLNSELNNFNYNNTELVNKHKLIIKDDYPEFTYDFVNLIEVFNNLKMTVLNIKIDKVNKIEQDSIVIVDNNNNNNNKIKDQKVVINNKID